jgi:ribonuclease III
MSTRNNKVADFLSHMQLVVEDAQLYWFEQALTHSSFSYEHKLSATENYERLEFLGDAVLKLIVSQYLFERFSTYREGELTKIRAVIVSDATLAELAQDLNMGPYLTFGPSEARSGGAKKVSNLACAFEAFFGALFLTGKLAYASQLFESLIGDRVTALDLSKTKSNFKAVLQEVTQRDGAGLPDYETVSERGPAHNRTFEVTVLVNGEVLGKGIGKSKKEAQQEAARLALIALDEI